MKAGIGTDRVARIASRAAAVALVATVALAGTPALQATAATAGHPTAAKPAFKPTVVVKKKPAKKKRKIRYRKTKASWYGPGFYGHGMAGGGTLRPNSMIVAHRTLPFGTKVQVVYKGKWVNAIVKDRGPFISGRGMDLGPGVAHKLKFSGVHKIKYRILKMGKSKK